MVGGVMARRRNGSAAANGSGGSWHRHQSNGSGNESSKECGENSVSKAAAA